MYSNVLPSSLERLVARFVLVLTSCYLLSSLSDLEKELLVANRICLKRI